MAATLIRPAQLMILDEPEQRLDLRIRQKLYDRLAVLRGSGTTLLVVTHDPQMLRHCLNHAFLLNEDQGEALHSEAGAQWLER
ncbi:AAA family ATPase [Glutamicibacter sp. M10]|nr:AAA family ATPase [Glutamicibacter sp. M10]UXN32066.1 AAA family ATPase [Glutamicibacter sp. M10]